MVNGAKRWCFTINNPTEEDKFWLTNPGQPDEHTNDVLVHLDYIILQEERGENGTLHWQGFLILRERHELNWMKRHLNKRAHWEIARGTNEEARNYCRKEETYTGGLRYEYGKLPERAAPKKAAERRQEAAEQLDILKDAYKRPREIPSMTLMECGFIPAMKELTADILGPYRPELKIITMVGPPATGKSYAIQHFFPEHGLCMPGNNGVWFQRPTEEVMVFEEFKGQIPLQRMLKLLDPYPYALEVKGGMRPAMYKLVIITSNTTPRFWYAEGKEDGGKQLDAIHALWDRIGYSDGSYIPTRTCGHYLEAPAMIDCFGVAAQEYIKQCREFFWNSLAHIIGEEPIEDEDDTPSSLPSEQDPNADIPQIDDHSQ